MTRTFPLESDVVVLVKNTKHFKKGEECTIISVSDRKNNNFVVEFDNCVVETIKRDTFKLKDCNWNNRERQITAPSF